MKYVKITAIILACIMTSSLAVDAAGISEPVEILTEDVAPQLENEDSASEEEVINVPAEEPIDVHTDDSVFDELEISDGVDADDVYYVDSNSGEDLVGAVSYRSIYEPCFSKVRKLNRQIFSNSPQSSYEAYYYTLLDLNYDGIKELIVNACWTKHGRRYYIYTINVKNYQAYLLGEVENDNYDPITTNGSRIAYCEFYKGWVYMYSSPFTGNVSFENITLQYRGNFTYKTEIAALKDISRKKFAANAVISPAFIEVSDLSLLNKAGNVSRFSDVIPNKTPHAKEVYWAVAKEITKGYPGTRLFGIDDTCTRGEAAMFLWRLAGKPSPKNVSNSPFSDVPKTHAFYKAILWAYQKGITKGYSNGKFGINTKCTRGQITTFIWRYKGAPKPKASKSSFRDALTPAFKNAIIWAAENGIAKGYSDNTFRDKQNCTRGEIVAFLYRIK